MNNKDQLKKLGERIRFERRKLNMSQEKLAELAGLTQYQHISKIERGLIDTRVSTFFAIINVLNLKLEDLIDIYNKN